MTTRRRFLGAAAAAAGLSLCGHKLASGQAHEDGRKSAAPLLRPQAGETLITILHTNDTHSQIDPLPANDPNAGRGGSARRATLVRQLRAANPHTLLVDA